MTRSLAGLLGFRGASRSPEEQEELDRETSGLVLYEFATCPYCLRVRWAMMRWGLKIPARDAARDIEARRQLLEGGGKVEVPCLRIREDGGGTRWLYESADIIAYLRELISDRRIAPSAG